MLVHYIVTVAGRYVPEFVAGAIRTEICSFGVSSARFRFCGFGTDYPRDEAQSTVHHRNHS